MVSVLISLGGLVGMIAVGKYKTDENKTDIENERKARQALGAKVSGSVSKNT